MCKTNRPGIKHNGEDLHGTVVEPLLEFIMSGSQVHAFFYRDIQEPSLELWSLCPEQCSRQGSWCFVKRETVCTWGDPRYNQVDHLTSVCVYPGQPAWGVREVWVEINSYSGTSASLHPGLRPQNKYRDSICQWQLGRKLSHFI